MTSEKQEMKPTIKNSQFIAIPGDNVEISGG
jgi:hypothetical protein